MWSPTTPKAILSLPPLIHRPRQHGYQLTPLWQVSMVTWVNPKQAKTLMSEQDVLAAKAAGSVTINQVNVVVNCPVVFTPGGGLLPNVKVNNK